MPFPHFFCWRKADRDLFVEMCMIFWKSRNLARNRTDLPCLSICVASFRIELVLSVWKTCYWSSAAVPRSKKSAIVNSTSVSHQTRARWWARLWRYLSGLYRTDNNIRMVHCREAVKPGAVYYILIDKQLTRKNILLTSRPYQIRPHEGKPNRVDVIGKIY